ncbi:MAG: translation initiation factor [Bacteroidales bacterium]|nr:translation initiation factor [Bacteroidales bacterium]
MSKSNDWKDRLGIVYSTNQEFSYEKGSGEEEETLPPEKQSLKIQLSTKHRKGKSVTLITGFVGKEEDLKSLEKEIKTKCATGGSVKDGEIIIQGDLREKISGFLKSKNYKVKG